MLRYFSGYFICVTIRESLKKTQLLNPHKHRAKRVIFKLFNTSLILQLRRSLIVRNQICTDYREELKATLVFLICTFAVIPGLFGDRIVNCKKPTLQSSIHQRDFAKRLQKSVLDRMVDDPQIRTFSIPRDEAHFKIHLSLKRYDKSPNKQAIICEYTYPNNAQNYLYLTYPDRILQERETSWLINQSAEKIVQQLKAEAVIEINARLNEKEANIFHLDPNQKRLSIDIIKPSHRSLPLAKRAEKIKKPLRRPDDSRQTDQVLGYLDHKKFNTPDPKRPPKIDPPKELVHINPFEAEKVKALSHRLDFPFPKFRVSGFPSMLLFPSLSWHQTHLDRKFSIETDTSWVREGFDDLHSFNQLNFDGHYLKQSISFSTLLWQRVNLSIETGMAAHDADVQLDIAHPSAGGGTTFLASKDLDLGLTDTVLSINHTITQGKMLFKPGLQFKFPTGDAPNLLGSNHSDLSVSVSAERTHNLWHSAARLAFVQAGDLGIFVETQEELKIENYITASLGFGKTLDLKRGEAISMSINYAQNPMRNISSFEDLDDEILTLGFLLEKALTNLIKVKADFSYGLSPSAPKFGLGVSFKLSH